MGFIKFLRIFAWKIIWWFIVSYSQHDKIFFFFSSRILTYYLMPTGEKTQEDSLPSLLCLIIEFSTKWKKKFFRRWKRSKALDSSFRLISNWLIICKYWFVTNFFFQSLMWTFFMHNKRLMISLNFFDTLINLGAYKLAIFCTLNLCERCKMISKK